MKSAEAPTAVRVLEKRFVDAISAGRVSGVECIERCCVLAAVGQGMVARKGAAATMFSALAKANVNIKAIAQVRAYAQAYVCARIDTTTACAAMYHMCPESRCMCPKSAVRLGRPTDPTQTYRPITMSASHPASPTLHPPPTTTTLHTHPCTQGSSEYNITVLVDQADSERALRAVHRCGGPPSRSQAPFALGPARGGACCPARAAPPVLPRRGLLLRWAHHPFIHQHK